MKTQLLLLCRKALPWWIKSQLASEGVIQWGPDCIKGALISADGQFVVFNRALSPEEFRKMYDSFKVTR